MHDTITAPAPQPLETPALLPDLEPAVLEEVADDILLDSVRATKVAKVPAGRASRGNRAWSYGGNVD